MDCKGNSFNIHCLPYSEMIFPCILAAYIFIDMKRNVSLLGFIIGAILPLLGVIIVYMLLFKGAGMSDIVRNITRDFDVTAKVLSLAIIINVIPFIFYTNNRLDLTARGILIATMLYAVLIVMLKFVW